MVNHLVSEFYTRFLSKIDALSQDVVFPLDIAVTFFNKLITDVRDFLISEGVQVTSRLSIETIHQGNQKLILVRKEAV